MTAQGAARRRIVVPQPPGSGRFTRTPGILAQPRREPVAAAVPKAKVARGPQRERHEPDYLLLITIAALAAVGLLMIYSTSGFDQAVNRGGDPFAAVAPQIVWTLLGAVVLFLTMRLDYRYLRLVSVPAYLGSLGLLVLVLMPPIGPIQPIEVGESARWLRIGALPAMHPAEIAKLTLAIYLAHWLAKRGTAIGGLWQGLVPFLVITAPCLALVAIEPDLGTTGVLTLTAFTMVFLAGASIWQLAALVPVGAAAVAVIMVEYQAERVTTWLDPWAVRLEQGYQTVQGLLALAMGGLTGLGLGGSSSDAAPHLPNAQNDFIFAVIGEELGFVGATIVIALYLVVAYRGVRIALGAPDTFGALLAAGITAWLTFQALINIGVVVTLLPITGITLPFVSDGGSSLVVSFAAVGILLSISRETQSRGTWNHADPDRGRGYGRPHLSRPRGPAVAG